MMTAYQQGRMEKNPAESWYKGELGFFDFYIIPLAKKLKDCGVFGVSSDEYLNYAEKNRAEWELRGHEVVARMVETFNAGASCIMKQDFAGPHNAAELQPTLIVDSSSDSRLEVTTSDDGSDNTSTVAPLRRKPRLTGTPLLDIPEDRASDADAGMLEL
jgi:hypothetical protein